MFYNDYLTLSPFVDRATIFGCERFSAIPTGKVPYVQVLSDMIIEQFAMNEGCIAIFDAAFKSEIENLFRTILGFLFDVAYFLSFM